MLLGIYDQVSEWLFMYQSSEVSSFGLSYREKGMSQQSSFFISGEVSFFHTIITVWQEFAQS